MSAKLGHVSRINSGPYDETVALSSAFADQLAVWGPNVQSRRAPTHAEAEAYCRRLAKSHYENFPVVTWLLPRPMHQPFCNIYAFCRWADDLGDEVGDPEKSRSLLKWWRDELAACYEGDAQHPVFVALRPTIGEFGIPQQPFSDLISAFEQDQTIRDYETFEELLDYCRRSANPVGRLVLYLCRQANDENFRWSDSICTGLQLANFWQDVARDFDIGRVYLPQEDRRRFGYSADDLRGRMANGPFLELMEFEVARTRRWLRPWRDETLCELAPFPVRLRAVIELFARGGERILDRIEAIGYRVWDTRPVVTKRDVAWMILGCLGQIVKRQILRLTRHA